MEERAAWWSCGDSEVEPGVAAGARMQGKKQERTKMVREES